MPEIHFTRDDTLTLSGLLYDGDNTAVTDWMRQHILTHVDMHALIGFLGRAIFKIFPLGITKDVVVDSDHYWAVNVDGAKPAHADAGRIISAAFNAEWQTMDALILAVLTHPEDHHAEVVAFLLSALGEGLRAAASAASERNDDA